jgi:curved DNA-binding protein CbpA
MRDPYKVLAIAPDADLAAIHRAFRLLAQELHPDRGGDAALMQIVNEAWAILSRPAYRRAYDEAKAAARERAQARRAGQVPPTSAAADTPPAGPPRPEPPERRPDTIDYGRYQGWTIRDLSQHDPDYLLWLVRTPAGRVYRPRILEALAAREAVVLARRPVAASGQRRSRWR